MKSDQVKFVVEVDSETDLRLRQMAEKNKRSRKRQMEVIARKVTARWFERTQGKNGRGAS